MAMMPHEFLRSHEFVLQLAVQGVKGGAVTANRLLQLRSSQPSSPILAATLLSDAQLCWLAAAVRTNAGAVAERAVADAAKKRLQAQAKLQQRQLLRTRQQQQQQGQQRQQQQQQQQEEQQGQEQPTGQSVLGAGT